MSIKSSDGFMLKQPDDDVYFVQDGKPTHSIKNIYW